MPSARPKVSFSIDPGGGGSLQSEAVARTTKLLHDRLWPRFKRRPSVGRMAWSGDHAITVVRPQDHARGKAYAGNRVWWRGGRRDWLRCVLRGVAGVGHFEKP